MALNRYYRIVKPAKYQTIFTKKFIITSASAVWCTLIFISLISAFAFGFRSYANAAFATAIIDVSRLAIPAVILVTYSPYFVIAFCYWKIYKVVKMHNANVSWQSANVEHVQVSKILLVTVVGFVSLWVPAHTIFIMSFYITLPRQLALFSTLLVYTSSFINPFIYGFMNRAFKNEFKKWLIPRNRQSIGTESS